MHLCRSALQRLVPLTQRSSATLLRNAPVRQMSASSVPGSAGSSLPYYLFVGVTTTGAGVYVYRLLTRDSERHRERDEIIEKHRAQQEESKTVEAEEVSETLVNAVEIVIEEAAAEEVAAQEEVQVATTSLELEHAVTVTEEETSPAPAEVEQAVTEEETSPAPAEVEHAVTEEEISPPAEEEQTVTVEASTQQVEIENVEPVAEDLPAETPPVLEASSDNIPEELASAAAEQEDWSELSARKPEEAAEESTAAGEEVEEAVEAEVSASS